MATVAPSLPTVAVAVTDAVSTTTAASFLDSLQNGTLETIEDFDTGLSTTLLIVMQLALLGFLIVVAAVTWRFRKQLKAICGPPCSRAWSKCRCRRMKKCLYMVFCCGCLPCTHHAHKSLGFERLAGATEMLRITLLCATDISKRMTFYIEVWSEPLEAVAKHSRTFQQAGGSLDMGGEQLDLDWFGDEDEIVFHIMEFVDGGGKDKPVGELKVERERIEKYAREAAGAKDDIKKGARSFVIAGLQPFEQNLRKKHQKAPNPFAVMAVTQAQDSLGMRTGPGEDVQSLVEENRRMREMLSQMPNQAASMQNLNTGKSFQAKSLAKVVMRFEIIPRAKKTVDFDAKLFQSSSFQETTSSQA